MYMLRKKYHVPRKEYWRYYGRDGTIEAKDVLKECDYECEEDESKDVKIR